MDIKTNDNQIIITDSVQTIAGNAGTFGYTYSVPTDSVTITKDGKSVTTGALSNFTVNGEALTPTNIDEKMKPIFLTLSGGGGGITEETDPLFTEWVNGTAIAAGNGANAGTSINIAIGRNAKATGQQSIAIGDQASTLVPSGTTIGQQSITSGENGTTIGYHSNAGNFAVAIGSSSIAAKQEGIAIGSNTKITNEKEIGFGENNSISAGTTADKTQLGIASFNSTTTDKKNVIEARQNDDIYIWKDGSQIKLQDHLGGGGGVPRKVIEVTDTKLRLDPDYDLIYIWDFNNNVPFANFTMEEDAATAALSTTNSATIILKFTGSTSSSFRITLPKNLVYSIDADAKFYINAAKETGSETSITSFKLKGNEMKIINIYGIGDKRIMEIDY